MSIVDLGKIGLTFDNGGWSASKYFEKYTVIMYNGQGFCSLQDNQNIIPGTDSNVWMIISDRGESLYQMMVRTGRYEGTEAEFLQEYQDALTACATSTSAANTAAANCNNTNANVAEAEALRVSAEAGRASAESARADAETLRSSAETGRASAESARASNETSRSSAETSRAAAESNRASAEVSRASAESDRASAETSRLSAETARVTAEASRAAAETARSNAEETRVAAEGVRQGAETSRLSAETARVTAEASRVTAEAAREAQASSDHAQAGSDHTQAESDHAQAGTDHGTAASDHTQAGEDHTRAETDHTQAAADHAAIGPTIAKADSALQKATPTAEQGTKEYLYSFAGQTQNTDIAVVNDMTGSSAGYTDRMVPTAKSVATALSAKAEKEGDEMAAIAILVSNLNARIAALENALKNGLPSLVVDNLEVRNAFTQHVSEGNSYLCGAGVPAAATVPDGWDEDEYGPWNGIPQFVGQRYLNTSTSKWYTAKGVTSVSDWVQDTNA